MEFGFKKGNTELAEKVKKTLLKQGDGTVDKITEKWFGSKDSFSSFGVKRRGSQFVR